MRMRTHNRYQLEKHQKVLRTILALFPGSRVVDIWKHEYPKNQPSNSSPAPGTVERDQAGACRQAMENYDLFDGSNDGGAT